MAITEITPDYSVSPQISVEDVAKIAQKGFKSIMCNRPDGESLDQTSFDTIRIEAERHGLSFMCIPVMSGAIVPENVVDFQSAIQDLPKPILAYCRSGTRCRNLWMLANG